jgi:transaldolase
MNDLKSLGIKLFADGANLEGMLEMASNLHISGLTTNPTLMRKAGVTKYSEFAREVLNQIKDKPISFEVFSDDIHEMKIQAEKISSWGENVYVKIPVTTTKGMSTNEVVSHLVDLGIKVNVTAVMTVDQTKRITEVLNPNVPSCISVFAGRIADTGQDPTELMSKCLDVIKTNPKIELIWASPRELLNIFQADKIGCHIITATNDILSKLTLIGKNLDDYSLETVKMFHDDAQKAGYSI